MRTPAEVDPPAELIQGYQTPGLFSVAEICSWLPRLAFSPATCRFWLVTTRSSVFYYCSDKISDKKQVFFFFFSTTVWGDLAHHWWEGKAAKSRGWLVTLLLQSGNRAWSDLLTAYPWDPLHSPGLPFPETLQPSQTASPSEDQVFKYMYLKETFHNKPQHSYTVHRHPQRLPPVPGLRSIKVRYPVLYLFLFSGSQGRSISSTGVPLNMMPCLYLWSDRDWENGVPLYYWLSCWGNHCLTKYRSLWGLSWKQDLLIVFHQGHPASFLEESSSLPTPCVGICLPSLDRHIFPDLFR